MSETNKLTPKQRAFCDEYLLDLNATHEHDSRIGQDGACPSHFPSWYRMEDRRLGGSPPPIRGLVPVEDRRLGGSPPPIRGLLPGRGQAPWPEHPSPSRIHTGSRTGGSAGASPSHPLRIGLERARESFAEQGLCESAGTVLLWKAHFQSRLLRGGFRHE